MINDPVNNLQIKLLEGPHSLVDFALSKNFNEHLSLPQSGRLIREELEYQRVITSQSVVQLPEHLPKNRPLGFLEYNVPKAAIVFEIFLGALGAARLFCKPVSKIKIRWGKMTVRRFGRQSNQGQPDSGDVHGLLCGKRLYDRPFIRLRDN